MLREEIKSNLRNVVSEKRYRHIIGVEETAAHLAKKYGVNEEKARVAALLHDYGKEMDIFQMQKICAENFPLETIEYMDQGEILHGYVGAYLAKKLYNIEDEEIIEAVKYHTTGKRGLSLLGKIIYIADSIEPGRIFPRVEEIRNRVYENLNGGILFECSEKIEYLLEIGARIHPYTVEMRNWLIEMEKKEK
ncbi:metal dependent phosphohydrolase [Cetobacterium ceti]|uniref:bis(5'-nucleosyl)-tetraphosphatase (symmetrical) n=1 Tax=Cetobacterium ceti TaxID=180163 RepID=A0A1T4NWR6_9FUSO|nr:bis(5'-nucleosyl)-tetraphosphatase (symmetrical) YqeK [Cetobacterium ceti]SJZ83724.1 metal dependent phosphohydrolase [Cetobacterium ceti]